MAAFKITDENNGLAKAVYQATLKLSVPREIRRVLGSLGMNVHPVRCRTMTGLRQASVVSHAGKFCVCVEVSMTYDWSGRKMRRMRAAKLTIISLVAAFVLTAPIFAHY